MSTGQNIDPRQKYNNDADVRAEVIAADYVSDGLRLRNVTIKPGGSYKRTYSRDVLDSSLEEDDEGNPVRLELIVSRDGLYDMIPEGLFHQPDPNRRENKVVDMVDNIKKSRKEEDDARRFFLAIEKEVYRQRILIEIDERKAYEDYSDHFRNDLFFQIWPDLITLKREFVNPLVQLLPRAFEVCGDIPLTEYCFRKVLGVEVKIFSTPVSTFDLSEMHTTRLGEATLGIDLFAGDIMVNFLPTIHIQVGPLKKYQLPDFLHGGAGEQAIQVLCNYFMPAEADLSTELVLEKEEEQLFLKSEKHEAILGFTSRI